jgi:metal-dependent amidase/aminoacylase/carboxypeptidase family protein
MINWINAYCLKNRDRFISLRRFYCKHPEVSNNEIFTSQNIRDHLQRIGVMYTCIGNGTIAIINGGQPGNSILWRADIDALPMSDKLNTEYRSINKGVKHACGHDVHITIALALADIFVTLKAIIKGNIILVFQHAEESSEGALDLYNNNIIKELTPKIAFSLHVGHGVPGDIILYTNSFMNGVRYFNVDLPHGKNQLAISLMKYIESLNTLKLSKNTPCIFEDNTHRINSVRIKMLSKANTETVVKYTGFISTFDEGQCAIIENKLNEWISTNAEKDACLNIQFTKNIPPVCNPERLVQNSMDILESIDEVSVQLNVNQFIPLAADDFSIFQKEYSGLYFILGCGYAPLHSGEFDVDENCINDGIRAMAIFLLSYFNREKRSI